MRYFADIHDQTLDTDDSIWGCWGIEMKADRGPVATTSRAIADMIAHAWFDDAADAIDAAAVDDSELFGFVLALRDRAGWGAVDRFMDRVFGIAWKSFKETSGVLSKKDRTRVTAADVASIPDIDYRLLYGQFLDDFERADAAVQPSLIAETPVPIPDRPAHLLALLAACCETLARRYGMDIPDWTENPRCFMPEPVYGLGTKNPEYRTYLRDTSPEEFARRNLFFGDNVMSRC